MGLPIVLSSICLLFIKYLSLLCTKIIGAMSNKGLMTGLIIKSFTKEKMHTMIHHINSGLLFVFTAYLKIKVYASKTKTHKIIPFCNKRFTYPLSIKKYVFISFSKTIFSFHNYDSMFILMINIYTYSEDLKDTSLFNNNSAFKFYYFINLFFTIWLKK